MTEHPAAPAPLRGLRLLPPGTAAPGTGTEPGTGSAAKGDTEAAPVSPSAVPLSVSERARLAVSHWAGTAAGGAGKLWFHPGRVLYVLWHGKPDSMAEHRAYIKSRAWVPEELRGHRSGGFIAAAGITYHLLIARPLKGVVRIIDGAADRPLRLLMLAVFVLILIHL
jgi:hypothetical protein